MHFYVMQKFCDFFTLRFSDLNTATLTYVLMDNFCPCFILNRTNNVAVCTHFIFYYCNTLSFSRIKKKKKESKQIVKYMALKSLHFLEKILFLCRYFTHFKNLKVYFYNFI